MRVSCESKGRPRTVRSYATKQACHDRLPLQRVSIHRDDPAERPSRPPATKSTGLNPKPGESMVRARVFEFTLPHGVCAMYSIHHGETYEEDAVVP